MLFLSKSGMSEASGGENIAMEETNIVIKIPNGTSDREEKDKASTGLSLPRMVKLPKPPGAKSGASGKVSPAGPGNDNPALHGTENNESAKYDTPSLSLKKYETFLSNYF